MAKIRYRKAPGKVAASAALIALLGLGAAGMLVETVSEQEGYVPEAYLDPVGVPTICYGDIEDVRFGQEATFEECVARLNRQLIKHAQPVLKCMPEFGELPDKVKVAFLDMAYNIGPYGFCSSSVAKLAKQGRLEESCRRMSQIYTTAKDRKTGVRKELPGLVKRRQLETRLCLAGVKEGRHGGNN